MTYNTYMGTLGNVDFNGGPLPAGDTLSYSRRLARNRQRQPARLGLCRQRSWTTPTNWTNNTVPNAAGNQAVVNVPTGASVSITLDGPQTVGTLLFGPAIWVGATRSPRGAAGR